MSVDVSGPGHPLPRSGDSDPPPSPAAVRTGRIAVAAIVLAGVVGTLAVLHDAQTTGPVISVPAAQAPSAGPRTLAQAMAAVLAFVPSGSTISLRSAIAAATGNSAGRVGSVRAGRFGKGWWVTVTSPVRLSSLERSGSIFSSAGQGSSDVAKGLIDVTAGTVEYVVRFDPKTDNAVYRFRLSSRATTLSALNWNANSVVSQTSIGNNDLP